jgi:O-antigen ligase
VLRRGSRDPDRVTIGRPHAGSGLTTGLLYAALAIAILLFSSVMMGRLGLASFTIFLAAIFFGVLYSYLSWRSLSVPFFVFILSVGGFRFLWAVKAPGLPDLYLDRMALIWLVVVFTVKAVAERKPLRPPYLLDVLLLLNALYLWMHLIVTDYSYFSLWTRSYLVPYAGYFMAKNILTTEKRMHAFLILLAVLNVYYATTSIAEKFRFEHLIWPKVILYTKTVWVGRSNGPFAHAPLFGTVQGMILPMYLYIIATSRNKLVQALSYAALSLAAAGLYFTYTRGSWLVGIFALLVAIAFSKGRYLKISAPAIALLPLIAIFVLGAGNDKFMKDRVENDDTVTSRLGVAVTAMRMFQAQPLFGVGFFQFRHVREQYVDPVVVPVFGAVRFANFRHTSIHDIYLGPLAETGLVGAFLQIAIYLVIFRAFIRHYRNREGPKHFRIYILPILGGLCIGYLGGGIAIDYRFFSMVGTMFYTAAGIVYGYQAEPETSGEA